MPKLIDRQPEQRFVGLFVGYSGTGKTVAEASFPKPLHINDFDGRVGGAQVPWLDMKDITYDYFPPRDPGLITTINQKLDGLLTAARLGNFGAVQIPKTYVTDSATSLTYAFICQAMPITHQKADPNRPRDDNNKTRGRFLGPVSMAGPDDYNLESQATYDYMSYLKTLPIQNIILSAHYIDKYEKQDPEDPYSPSVVAGKKLSIRDKIAANLPKDFDHVFEFEREIDRFYVRFWGELARTTYPWLPKGRIEWTGKNFYELMLSYKPKGEGEK